jgi:hypothetical protein
MTEELRKEQKGFKIWLNPPKPGGVIRFLGEFHPPAGQFFFFPKDLTAMGLGPGRYSVLAPESGPYRKFLKRWQSVVISA